MKSRLVAAAFVSFALAACGGDSGDKNDKPATPPAAPVIDVSVSAALEGAPGARAVVEAYLAAARVPDEAAMLALGTPEWREKERTWGKAFTKAIVGGKLKAKTFEVRDPTVEGETAKVSVKAVFVDESGRDDGEGMRFELVRKDGRWWITRLG